jgi:hypothetical protein
MKGIKVRRVALQKRLVEPSGSSRVARLVKLDRMGEFFA